MVSPAGMFRSILRAHTQTHTVLVKPSRLIFLIFCTVLLSHFLGGGFLGAAWNQRAEAFPFKGRLSVSLPLVVSPRLLHLPPSPEMKGRMPSPPWGIWWRQLALLFKLYLGIKLEGYGFLG